MSHSSLILDWNTMTHLIHYILHLARMLARGRQQKSALTKTSSNQYLTYTKILPKLSINWPLKGNAWNMSEYQGNPVRDLMLVILGGQDTHLNIVFISTPPIIYPRLGKIFVGRYDYRETNWQAFSDKHGLTERTLLMLEHEYTEVKEPSTCNKNSSQRIPNTDGHMLVYVLKEETLY